MTLKKRVVAYARVSTDSDDQKNSYDNQQSYFEREIKKNDNYEYIDIYADRGITGTSLTKRKEFNRMLTDAGLDINNGFKIIAKPKFDMIFVKNTSRFARNLSVDVILKALVLNNVFVYFLDLNKSTENQEDITYIQIFLTFDEQFSRDISGKVKFGMKEGAMKGNINVGAGIFGYNYIPHPENRLEIIEEEAEVVRLIFDLYVNENMGTERIARELGAREIFTRRGKRFKSTTLLTMLKNEKYYGMNDGMKYYTGDLFGDRKIQHIPKEKQIRFETDKIPAIISKEIFDNATDIRENRTSHKQNKGRYLGKTDYAGIVICGKCGTSYQSCGTSQTKTKTTRYFACRHRYRYDTENGIPQCMNPSITQEKLDELLNSTSYSFRRWVRVRNGLNELRGIRTTLENRIDKDNEEEVLIAQKQLEDTNLKKIKILDLYLENTFTKEQLDSRIKPIELFIQDLEDKINALSKTNEDIYNDIAEVEEIIEAFEEENNILQTEFNNGNIAHKYSRKELLKDISGIVVGTDGELTLNFKSLSIINQITNKYRHLIEKAS